MHSIRSPDRTVSLPSSSDSIALEGLKRQIQQQQQLIYEKDMQIDRLEHLVVQLQDLILEERSIELERLKELMNETAEGKRLDVCSNSTFALSPSRTLGDLTARSLGIANSPPVSPHNIWTGPPLNMPPSPVLSPSATTVTFTQATTQNRASELTILQEPPTPAPPPAILNTSFLPTPRPLSDVIDSVFKPHAKGTTALPLKLTKPAEQGKPSDIIFPSFPTMVKTLDSEVYNVTTASSALPTVVNTNGNVKTSQKPVMIQVVPSALEETWAPFPREQFLSTATKLSPAPPPPPVGLSPANTSPKQQKLSKASEEIKYGKFTMDDSKSGASLFEMQGQIYHLTKYQAGCRFLQKQLEESYNCPENVTIIFNEVYDHIVDMMTDPYGQYLVPKLMQYCSSKQRYMIVSKISSHVVSFACNPYGSHGVQKILEFLNEEQVSLITETIKPNMMLLIKDPKGNYLLQSFLKTYSHSQVEFLYEFVKGHCLDVSTHKVGCTVVSRCIDYASSEQLEDLMRVLIANELDLVQDQYGNYVIQHILSHCPLYISRVIGALYGSIPRLCTQKFSSNVIEKCLKVADKACFERLIGEIASTSALGALLQDQYGNFVVQTALDVAVSNPEHHANLVKQILPYLSDTTFKTPYLMHIRKKILG
ncbi:armadillo-type protein [Pelomyxa schiedti]|nr:armadillo-type protein [Pelomyxa schiedti]